MIARWCREYGLYALMLLAVAAVQAVFDYGRMETFAELSGAGPRLANIPDIAGLPGGVGAGEGPLGLLAVSVGIVVALGMGLTADIVFVMKWLLARSQGKSLLRLGQNPPSTWVWEDLIKLFVIFLFTVTMLHALLYTAVAQRWIPSAWLHNISLFVPTLTVYAVMAGTLRGWRRARSASAFAANASPAGWAAKIGLGALGYVAFVPALMLLLFASIGLCRALGIEPEPHAIVELLAREKSTGRLIGLGVLTVALGPVIEEIVFRGVAYTALRKRFGVWLSAAISSLLFAFAHGNIAQGLPIFGMGMMLALLLEHTGDLKASMVFHALNNTMAFILTLLVLHWTH